MDWHYSTFAGLLAIPHFLIARKTGEFFFALHGLKSPLECSSLFLNPICRFLAYYLPIIGLAFLCASWLTGWISIVPFGIAIVGFAVGSSRKRTASIQQLALQYIGEGIPPATAFDRARHTIDAIVAASSRM